MEKKHGVLLSMLSCLSTLHKGLCEPVSMNPLCWWGQPAPSASAPLQQDAANLWVTSVCWSGLMQCQKEHIAVSAELPLPFPTGKHWVAQIPHPTWWSFAHSRLHTWAVLMICKRISWPLCFSIGNTFPHFKRQKNEKALPHGIRVKQPITSVLKGISGLKSRRFIDTISIRGSADWSWSCVQWMSLSC